MAEWTNDPAEAGDWETQPGEWTGETDPVVDYQLREVEARLDRRLATMEARHARTRGVAMVAGAAFIVTLVSLVVVVGKAVTDDGARTLQSLTAQEIMLRDDDGIERGRLSRRASRSRRAAPGGAGIPPGRDDQPHLHRPVRRHPDPGRRGSERRAVGLGVRR